MTRILRRIDGWRFELPLAVVLALSTGFMVLVMPARLLARLPGITGLGTLMQPVAAAVAAALGGLVAFGLMRVAGQPARARQAAHDHVDEEGALDLHAAPARAAEESVTVVAAESIVRVRRADAHPDAPPRAPILAMRDLGAPFMDFAAEPARAAETAAIVDADFVELPHGHEDEPAPVRETVAPAPAPAPAPAAAPRVERQSIADMMARLDAGMMRRSGPVLPPRDARPALRDALAELNRLAARRG